MLKFLDTYKDSSSPFFLLAGPCVVENQEMPLEIATRLKIICQKLGIELVFKASYRKANRSREDSFTGIGDQEALRALERVKTELGLPIVTDIHSVEEAHMAAELADILQIPAFLCRQSELLHAAAKTGRLVNIKKGQFVSAEAMSFAVEKVQKAAALAGFDPKRAAMLCERGSFFGYQDLVVDFRSIPIMKGFGVPVVCDITHSVQKPNSVAGVSGGDPSMIESIAKAAIAVGADGIFLETHPSPKDALSDGSNMLELSRVEALLEKLLRIRAAI